MRRVLKFVFLINFFLIAFFYNYKLKEKLKFNENQEKSKKIFEQKNIIKPQEKEIIKFYYPNENLTKLLVGKTYINKNMELKEKLNLILKLIREKTKLNIKNQENINFLDEYLEIENVYLDNGDLYVDFNLDFRNDFIDKNHELYFTYSLVNSFSEILGINRIKFLIFGREIKELKYYNLNDFLHKYNGI